MSYSKQVDKKHYAFGKYFHKQRWMSYWYQADEIINLSEVNSILDIGPGTDFLRHTLALHNEAIEYKSMDIAQDITTDIKGSVTEIPLKNNSFDIVSAFQVLEHIEFSDFKTALSEMCRVSKKYVLISLPHYGSALQVDIKIPMIPRLRWAVKFPRPKEHAFDGQHYWEVGKKGYSPKKIRRLMRNFFDIEREYIPFENQDHRFYVLKVKSSHELAS